MPKIEPLRDDGGRRGICVVRASLSDTCTVVCTFGRESFHMSCTGMLLHRRSFCATGVVVTPSSVFLARPTARGCTYVVAWQHSSKIVPVYPRMGCTDEVDLCFVLTIHKIVTRRVFMKHAPTGDDTRSSSKNMRDSPAAE